MGKTQAMKIVEQLYDICVESAHYFDCDLSYLFNHFRMNISQDVNISLKSYGDMCSDSDVIMSQLRNMQIYVFQDIDQADDGMVTIEPRRGQFKVNINERIYK